MSGLPKTVILSPEEVREAIDEQVAAVVDSVIACLGQGAGAGIDEDLRAGHHLGIGEVTVFRKLRVAFAAPYPGKIIPFHLDQLGGEMICQKDAFLCGARGVQVSIAFQNASRCVVTKRTGVWPMRMSAHA